MLILFMRKLLNPFLFKQLTALILIIVLSGILNIGVIIAAEIVNVEVVAGNENEVIEVKQGETKQFKIKIYATGNLRNTITQSNPSRARIHTQYSVVGSSVSTSNFSGWYDFWSNGTGPHNSPATWYGYPAPYEVTATVAASSDAVPEEYTVRILTETLNPIADPPGQTLRDETSDYLTIKVVPGDTIAPTTTHSLSGTPGNNEWFTSNVSVTLSAADNPGGSGVNRTEYSLDSGTTWNLYAAPVLITNEGVTTILYRSIDNAENVEGAKSAVIKIDKTPPSVSATGVSDGDYKYEVNVGFEAEDPSPGSGVATVTATLNGSSISSSTTVSEEGIYELIISVSDFAGHESSTTLHFTIDRTSPNIVIHNPADGGKYNTAQTFHFTITDSDPLVSTSSTHPDGHVFSDEGSYTATVSAEDRAGNSASSSVSFIIDMTPPETTITLSGTPGENDWWKSDVTAYLNATDPESGGVASGIDKTFYRINGGSWVEYDGSLNIMSEGTNLIEYYSTDEAGNTESTKSTEVRIDKTKPDAWLNFTGTIGGDGWYISTVNAAADGTDTVSGISYFEYTLDGGGWTLYPGPVLIGEGIHEISVRAVDVTGNIGDTVSYIIKVDLTPPETSHSLEGTLGNNGWYTSEVTVTLSAEDTPGGSGVERTEYSLDDSATWIEYAGPFVISSEGITTIQYRSSDKAGNIEDAKSVEVKIDTRPPEINISGVSDGSYVREATISFDADDPSPGSEVYIVSATLNVFPFDSGTTVDTEGDYELIVFSEDNAGNISSKSVVFTIDRTAPEIIFNNPDDGGEYNSDQVLDFEVNDSDPYVETWSNYENGNVFSDEGAYSVTVNAWDRATNYSSSSISFIIDKTKPETIHALSGTPGNNGWWVSDVTFYLNTSDPISGGVSSGVDKTFYRINGGLWEEYTGGFTLSDEGTNVVEYYSVDEAGNIEDTKSVEIRIDKTAPNVTVNSPSSGTYYYGQEIEIDFHCEDAISGLATSQAFLNGTEVNDGEHVFLTNPGNNTFIVEAVDNAGNKRKIETTFTVAFKPGKWIPPVPLGHTWNAGRMLPIKFTVLDSNDNPTDDAIATVEVLLNGSFLTQGTAYIQYDSNGLPFYQFNAKTLKGQAGTLTIKATLNDGTTVMQTEVLLR